MKLPYSDEHMIYDYKTHRYILTPAAILDNFGIDLVKVAKRQANQQIAISAILKTTSQHVYNFIHLHNANNRFQDYLIAKTESGRSKVYRAMLEQFMNLYTNGDLSRSTDKEKRALWFDESAKEILSEPLDCIGVSLTYTGSYGCWCSCLEEDTGEW